MREWRRGELVKMRLHLVGVFSSGNCHSDRRKSNHPLCSCELNHQQRLIPPCCDNGSLFWMRTIFQSIHFLRSTLTYWLLNTGVLHLIASSIECLIPLFIREANWQLKVCKWTDSGQCVLLYLPKVKKCTLRWVFRTAHQQESLWSSPAMRALPLLCLISIPIFQHQLLLNIFDIFNRTRLC